MIEAENMHTPTRRCAFTRARAPKQVLLRLVLDPDRRPFVDVLGRAPGRGVYVRPDRVLLEEALSPKGLGRAFKGQAVPLDEDEISMVVEGTIDRIESRILELVTLARRAGKLLIGMESVVRAKPADGWMVLAAKDLSERSFSELGDIRAPIVRIGLKAQLGARLGREDTGIVAIEPSVFAERVTFEAERLAGLTSASTSTNPASRGRVRAARKKEQD